MKDLRKDILAIIEKNHAGDITYFNPLGFWGEHLEPQNSKIIAELLNVKDDNPYCKKGKHKTLFFRKFLENVLELDLKYNIDEVEVITESHTKGGEGEKSGRIDIEIKLDSETSILIENKVNARLDAGQLAKYYRQNPAGNKHIVYLSLEGEEPTEESLIYSGTTLDKNSVICISYRDIANWLDDCLLKIKGEKGLATLESGVKMYLDTVYNNIGDERSMHKLWERTYLDIFNYIDTNNISLQQLQELEDDDDGYINSIVEMIEKRNRLIEEYNMLSGKISKDKIFISYTDIYEDKIHNNPITDLKQQITNILASSVYWVGFSICVYESKEDCDLYLAWQIDRQTEWQTEWQIDNNYEVWIGLSLQGEECGSFDLQKYISDHKDLKAIEVSEEYGGGVYYFDDTAKVSDSFCKLAGCLINDFKNFDSYKGYLCHLNGAVVYNNVMQFLKDSNIAYDLKYSNDITDLSLYNHDWYLYFSDYALGYGFGSMWLYTDNLEHSEKLKKLGFKQSFDKNYGYGEILDFVFHKYFEEDDTVQSADIEPLTQDIKNKIKEILE
ncbi:MAG: hypothetical protein ATN35_01750 [Epulopiscium sp. Nele67-Bin004]|nr:MAG: hypothetical protein ATN35_01750 [Epulopiscium sp. Nele67-Bin004]